MMHDKLTAMTTFTALSFLALLLVGTWLLLEHNFRRTAGLPRAPFGVDVDSDTDLRRVQHDLDVAPRSR